MGGASSACKPTRVMDQSYLYIYTMTDPTTYTSFPALPERNTSPDGRYALIQLTTQEPGVPRREQSNQLQSSWAPTAASSSRPKMSLKSLLEQDEDSDSEELRIEEESDGVDPLCCVCMLKKKGAAFIPCGHTFCCKCATEVQNGRGACPLSNRRINSVLKIY